MLELFPVQGNSMHPIYSDGDHIIVIKKRFCLSFKSGDKVVFRTSDNEKLVKVIAHKKDNKFYVIGASENSQDSRTLGYIRKEQILGKVLFSV